MQRLLKQYRNDVGNVLAEADVHLLELEVAGERTDPELLGRLSRLVHGLRGSAGLLGLEGACRMARLVEIACELARDGTLPLSAPVVSALEGCMRALAGLSGVVETEEGADEPTGDSPPDVAAGAHVAGGAQLAEAAGQYSAECVSGDLHALDQEDSPAGRALLRLVALLEEALPESLRVPARELLPVCDPDGHCLFVLHGIDVLRARRDGLYLYVVEFGGTDDLLRKDLSPLGLLAFLRKSGLVLDARFVPGPDGAGPGMPGCGLHVLYASILEPDLVNTVFQVESARVHPIDVEGVRRGEPGWQRAPARTATMAAMAVREAPDADSIDDLVREYDTAMRKLREDTMSNGTDDESRFSGTVVNPDAEERRLAELEAELAAGMDALALDDDGDGEGGDDASRRALASLIGGMVGDDAAPDGAGRGVAADDADTDLFAGADDGLGANDASDRFGSEGLSSARFEAEHPDGEAGMADEAASAASPVLAADSDDDPDADLFADSGDAPDLSYLDAVLDERPADGVALDLSAGVASRTVAGFTVRAADGDSSPRGGAKGVLVLSGEVTIERGADLREALLDVLGSFATVRIDLSGVTAADLTLVQLLQSAAVTARARGVDLAATGLVSEAVAEAARRTGLDVPGIRRVGLEKLLLAEGV
ncbi:STAS domain-containing protein [Nitratidesulfovibrio liaohensis]|uniref:STAS domain-containing protein n=1 Tax=Nitratidesulfovibrio liaohensis TaxID=2604158 RepID=A0ABY9R5D8_9BACT|nr:STAS domain-containing protein [Nitratidesulfovibrio liaohensis]WMW65820.1 STAS domain-containing protein [Nitratidesulfovibrio liaohensis]